MIPASFIQDLLTRVDIVEVVGRYVELKKAGINHKGLCPFHGEKTPSFIVSPSRQTYHCFGCGVHGDAVRFLSEHGGLGFVEAVTDLAQQVGMAVPQDSRSPDEQAEAARRKAHLGTLHDVLARAAQHYRRALKASPEAIDYLKSRGLSGEIAARFGLGWAPDAWRGLASAFPQYDDPLLVESGLVIVSGEDAAEQKRYDRFRGRVMFPIRAVAGDIIGFGGRVLGQGEPKYLNSPETPAFVKGRELYGLHEARTAIRQAGHVLVVEGYMDVVALAQHGIGQAVATLGTACTEDHVRKLFRFTDSVVFSFDGDDAGRRAARRALEAALPHATDARSIRFLFLPREHDPDSYVRELGREAFEREIDQASPLSQQMLQAAREGCDMATPEGRARYTLQAGPLWRMLPEGALQRQMLQAFAREAGVGEQDLMGSWRIQGHGHRPARSDDGPSGRADTGDGAMSRGGSTGSGLGSKRRSRKTSGGDGARGTGRTRPPPRRPVDHLTYLLLTHPEWFEALSPEDLELVHALPQPHAGVLAWFERDMAHEGHRPWAAVRAVLQADPVFATALPLVEPATVTAEEPTLTDLEHSLNLLRLEALQREQSSLAAAAAHDPQALAAYKAVHARWQALKAAIAAHPAGTA